MKKIMLLSLCWASILPAMEPKKELSTYEQAMELLKLTTAQKAAVIDTHNQSNPLLKLPDEILDNIAQYLIGNVAYAQSQEQLQTSVQAITRLQSSCHRFNNLLQHERYQQPLKQKLKIVLAKLNIPLDLIDAVKNKHNPFIIKALIKFGTDIDKQDIDGKTALIIATIKGYSDIVNDLIKAGAVLNKKDKSGFTALIWAAEKGHTDIVNALINAGADIHKLTNVVKNTALMWAAIFGHIEIVDALIKAHADINKQDKCRETALMWAAEEGHTDIVNALINAGADISLKNYKGKTALDFARKEGHTKIVELLESASAEACVYAKAYVYAKATPHRTPHKSADKVPQTTEQSARNE